jgi:hypothetical protein
MKPSVKVARHIVVTMKALDDRHEPLENVCQRPCFGVVGDVSIFDDGGLERDSK